MIEVPAEDDAFVLQRRIGSFHQANHVVAGRAAHACDHHAHVHDRVAQDDRSRSERPVDSRLDLGGRFSRGGEQGGSDLVVHREVGDGDAVVVEQRFRGAFAEPIHDSGDAGQPLQVRRVLAIRLADDEEADGAVPLRVQSLETDVRRGRVADAVEDRIGVVLLRLVVEDEDDLSSRVEPRVIVVVELRGGDAEPGEHHRGGRFRVAREEADEVLEKLVALLLAGAAQRELRLLHVGQVLDDRGRPA